jgi:hypothetical protein
MMVLRSPAWLLLGAAAIKILFVRFTLNLIWVCIQNADQLDVLLILSRLTSAPRPASGGFLPIVRFVSWKPNTCDCGFSCKWEPQARQEVINENA